MRSWWRPRSRSRVHVPGAHAVAGSAGPGPGRNLLKKFILVRRFSARLHGHGLRRPSALPRTMLPWRAIALRVIRSGDLHFAVHLRAFFDGNAAWSRCPRGFLRCGPISTRSRPRTAPFTFPRTMISRASTSAEILPCGPTVTRPSERWMVPCTSPSMYKSSRP